MSDVRNDKLSIMEVKDIIKKYVKVTETIGKTKKSVNEISLTAIGTLSLTDLKKNFSELLQNGTLTKEEFDAIFSEKTIKELRPYKATLMGLTDKDMGIVSKDYVSDIISYIIGIKLPSASSYRAWENAKKFVENELHLTKELFDIEKELPTDVFVANNYKKVLQAHIDARNHRYDVPVMVDQIYNDEHYLSMVLISFYHGKDTVTVEDILNEKENVIQKYKTECLDNDMDTIPAFVYDTRDELRALLMDYDFNSLDFSKTLSPEGKKYQLPVLEKIVKMEDAPYDDDYLNFF